MLTIANDLLPTNTLCYLAFRVACLDTIERMVLARQFDIEWTDGFGYLTEVPFLRAVPPQVQLDLLAEAWHKQTRRERIAATLVDESVLFAVCETTARVAEQEPPQFRQWAAAGPRKVLLPAHRNFPRELRRLHLSLPNEGDFLLVSQFEDIPPLEALALKAQFGLEPSKCDPLFEVLGRWHVTQGLAGRLAGLLTDHEIAQAIAMIKLFQSPSRLPQFPA